MAVKFTGGCWRKLSSSFASPHFLARGEWLSAGSGLCRDGQQRCLAREADTKKKVATPNAAKNVKAKTVSKKEEKKEQRARFNDLIDACLNAPPPVVALKEKERLRLLEREKLGVMSPERQREVEQEKAREKAAKKKKAKEAGAKPATAVKEDVKVHIDEERIVPADTEGEDQVSLASEEGKRLAKECSRVLLKEHREREKALSIKLQLQMEALAALPPHLRQAAVVPDLTPFPKSRIPASLTPPIRGYIEDRASAAAKAVTVKKSR